MLGERIPKEILDSIRRQLVSGQAVAEHKDIVNSEVHEPLIKKLEAQI